VIGSSWRGRVQAAATIKEQLQGAGRRITGRDGFVPSARDDCGRGSQFRRARRRRRRERIGAAA
jgi:hypothetical protein